MESRIRQLARHLALAKSRQLGRDLHSQELVWLLAAALPASGIVSFAPPSVLNPLAVAEVAVAQELEDAAVLLVQREPGHTVESLARALRCYPRQAAELVGRLVHCGRLSYAD